MYDEYRALQTAAEEAQQALAERSARLMAVKAEKTAKARQLNAAQEELRHAGLLSMRRNQLRAEVARLTTVYAATAKEHDALAAQVESARTKASQCQQALEAYEAQQPIRPVTESEALPEPPPVRTIQPRTVRSPAVGNPVQQTEHLLKRLEQFYPEHQVFALDSISSDLRTRLLMLSKHRGFSGVQELLASHGWTCIRGAEVTALRRGMYCTPGREPEVIKPQVESMLRRLKKCYPDGVIRHSLQREHKSLSQDVTGLYQWLGYESATEMLAAYGYQYVAATRGGRPATDAEAVFEALREAYGRGEKPRSVQQMLQEHPELTSALKTLQNRAPKLYGMTLREKLVEEGLL